MQNKYSYSSNSFSPLLKSFLSFKNHRSFTVSPFTKTSEQYSYLIEKNACINGKYTLRYSMFVFGADRVSEKIDFYLHKPNFLRSKWDKKICNTNRAASTPRFVLSIDDMKSRISKDEVSTINFFELLLIGISWRTRNSKAEHFFALVFFVENNIAGDFLYFFIFASYCKKKKNSL